jgi:hypothetical protein
MQKEREYLNKSYICQDFIYSLKFWDSDPILQAYFPRMRMEDMGEEAVEIEMSRRNENRRSSVRDSRDKKEISVEVEEE